MKEIVKKTIFLDKIIRLCFTIDHCCCGGWFDNDCFELIVECAIIFSGMNRSKKFKFAYVDIDKNTLEA